MILLAPLPNAYAPIACLHAAHALLTERAPSAQMTIPNFHNEAGTGTWDAAAGRTCAEENPLAVTKGSEV